MQTLFPVGPVLPEGFTLIPDFLTEGEEQHLMDEVSKVALHPMRFQGYEAKRKVASFGYDWSFEKRSLSKGKEIPSEFFFLIQKVGRKLSLEPDRFVELLVTEYPIGSVINWHRDAPPFGLIAGISLFSDCTFRLRPYEKSKQGRSSIISFPLKRRSLYTMDGEARSAWEHSISPMKAVRYSITLRTVKEQISRYMKTH